MAGSKRFARRAERAVNKDTFVREDAGLGLVVTDSPNDPRPGIRIENGRIVEIDGCAAADFDMIDRYIARYAIDVAAAAEAMAMESLAIARMLVDIHVPRARLRGSCPAARPPSCARSSRISTSSR